MPVSKRLVVYIAGPISHGDLIANIKQAHAAAVTLMAAGHSPLVPHGSAFWGNLVSLAGAFYPERMPRGTKHEDWMGVDLPLVAKCDAVLRLPGDSKGADMEVAHALLLGIPVHHDIEELLA